MISLKVFDWKKNCKEKNGINWRENGEEEDQEEAEKRRMIFSSSNEEQEIIYYTNKLTKN